MANYDIIIIGGGPAGLAAALKLGQTSTSALLIEREARLGGILKQCIHDGFGLLRFNEKLSGPEYAEREIEALNASNVTVKTLTFVTDIKKRDVGFELTLITRQGIEIITGKRLILATGCRERTSKQVAIHGTNPSGVLTAGSAQYYMNILGQMPTKRCVILGSGDIGLIMARRITLEGGQVLGVYEIKDQPSGLTRNLIQCLEDYNIPLYLKTTVTRVFGHDRLTGVEIAQVDEKMQPIKGSEQYLACDALILSVGLIPENEMAEKLEVPINPKTKGPYVDQGMETLISGIYCSGNALHVSDVADLVSETGEMAALTAQNYQKQSRNLIEIDINERMAYVVPSHLDLNKPHDKVIFYFRSRTCLSNQQLKIYAGDQLLLSRKYRNVRPPEMERIIVDLTKAKNLSTLKLQLEDES